MPSWRRTRSDSPSRASSSPTPIPSTARQDGSRPSRGPDPLPPARPRSPARSGSQGAGPGRRPAPAEPRGAAVKEPTWRIDDDDGDPEITGTPRPLFVTGRAARKRAAAHVADWVGAAIVGALLGVAALFAVPHQANATTTLLMVSPNPGDESAMTTDVSLLMTRKVAERVISDLGLGESPETVLSTVTATPASNQILTVTVGGPSEAAAVARARALVDHFLVFRAQQLRSISDGLITGYDNRVCEPAGTGRRPHAAVRPDLRREAGRPGAAQRRRHRPGHPGRPDRRPATGDRGRQPPDRRGHQRDPRHRRPRGESVRVAPPARPLRPLRGPPRRRDRGRDDPLQGVDQRPVAPAPGGGVRARRPRPGGRGPRPLATGARRAEVAVTTWIARHLRGHPVRWTDTGAGGTSRPSSRAWRPPWGHGSRRTARGQDRARGPAVGRRPGPTTLGVAAIDRADTAAVVIRALADRLAERDIRVLLVDLSASGALAGRETSGLSGGQDDGSGAGRLPARG